MTLWTGAEAAAATGGTLVGDFRATGLSIDTRSISPGELFIALKDQRDGHDFVADALAKGAAGALVDHRPEAVSPDAPLLIVEDVLGALGAMARAGRARSGAKVIAVTGSAGKTSTKEMLRTILSRQGRTHAAEASFNNHWGVPLTLARMPRDSAFAVVEIGMNHPGEIAPLSVLTQPDVAVVTTVAAAHLEAFDSVEGIAQEKASIFSGLEAGGVAVVNLDLPVSPILLDAARDAQAQIVTFGETEGADMRAIEIQFHDAVTVVKTQTGLVFKVMAPGRHFALNALAALAAAEAAGADLDIAAADLAAWQPPAGRGLRQVVVLDTIVDGWSIDLIDDAFNANPASMAAGLEVLAAAHPRDEVGRVRGGRRVAVLGDMLELGPTETELHRALADLPAMQKISTVHCVGPRMRELYQALPLSRRGHWTLRADEMAARAASLVDAGDVVLVKGSKSSKVSLVVDAIRKLGHPLPEQEGPG